MVYSLSGVQKLTSATDNRLSADRAAAAAGRIRLRLAGDPHASRLLPAASLLERLRGHPWGISLAEAQTVLRRSHYFDHALTRFLTPPLPGQVVLLEGRYDTRPWRFADELNGRPVFALAEERASGRIRVSPTEALSAALRTAGCKAGERTLFLWEGGAMYRNRAEVKASLSAIRGLSGPGSLLVMDGWSQNPVQNRPLLLGQPIRFAIHPEDLSGLLSRMGFEITDIADAEELRRRFPPEGARGTPACFVISARLTGL